MKTPRVLVTAGFDRAPHVLTLVELLRRKETQIEGIMVVTPYSIKRLRFLIRQRGPSFLKSAVRRLLGGRKKPKPGPQSKGSRDALAGMMNDHGITATSLRKWARTHEVPYQTVNSINDPDVVAWVEDVQPDWVVYGGGGILHNAFIDAAKGRILNAHAGPLPEIRGMNACEWSILLGYNPAVTIHLINRGIDTGGILSMHPFPVHGNDTIEHIRSRSVATGVEAMYHTLLNPPESIPEPAIRADASRQCYTIAPALREILEQRIGQLNS